MLLSALDPTAHGHQTTKEALLKLKDFFPTVLNDPGRAALYDEVNKFSLDPTLVTEESQRVNKWWNQIFKSAIYPSFSRLVKACLSIFTGPQVEQSFSSMNLIINKTTNCLDVQTFSARQSLKYDMKARKKTSLQLFHRESVQYSSIDKALVFHMQTAHSRHNKKMRERRAKVVEPKEMIMGTKKRKLGRKSSCHPSKKLKNC